MQNLSLNEEVDALPQALKDIVMSSEFQSIVAEIQSLPASERSQAVATQMTPEALAARGIHIPEGFTITKNVDEVSDMPFTANVGLAVRTLGVCFTNPLTGKQIWCF